MAATQYLIPGGQYVNEDTDQREVLVPGSAYLNETSAAPAGLSIPVAMHHYEGMR